MQNFEITLIIYRSSSSRIDLISSASSASIFALIMLIINNIVYILSIQMGGMCFSDRSVSKQQITVENNSKSKIQDVDVVKVKLKTARDRINNLINAKNRDIAQIDAKISQKIPRYQQTGNKKQLVPLLKSKKDLATFINDAELRLRLVSDKLAEVQLQKMNVDTVNVLDDANKYIKVAQSELEKKDWRNVLQQAKQKYQLEWPQDDENVQNDPKFIAMWRELGGDKIPTRKQVNVNIPSQNAVKKQKPKLPQLEQFRPSLNRA